MGRALSSPGQRPRTRSPLWDGSGDAMCPLGGEAPRQQARARTPHRGPGPPASVWTSNAIEPTYRVGVRSCHVSRRHGRRLVRKPSDGRLATHRIQCAWLRRALPPRHARQPLTGLTVHRVLPRYTVQPLATHPTQSPSAALIGYDGTALFHHAAYAVSYATRSATWQATPLDMPGAVPTRRCLDMLNEGL